MLRLQLFIFLYVESGIYSRFEDSINGIYLDLLCTKLEPTLITGKGKDRQQQNSKLASSQKEAETGKEEALYVIDLNHLKGHARVFSEGAIKFAKGYGWELRKDAPIVPNEEQVKNPKKDKDKKLLSMFRDDQAGAEGALKEVGNDRGVTGSTEDLTPGVVPSRKLKHVLGRVKEAEMLIIENLINREKSKSF